MSDKEANVVLNFKSNGSVQMASTIKQLNAVMNTAAKEYRAQIAAMGDSGSAIDKLSAKQQKLTTQYEAAQKRTKMMTDEYNRLKSSGNASADALAKQAGKVADAQRAESSLKNQLDKVNGSLTDQGKKSLDAKEKLTGLTAENEKLDAKQNALNASFKRQQAEISKDASETEKDRLKKQQLTQQLEVTSQKTKVLEQSLRATETAYGKNSTEAEKMRTKLDESKTAEINLQKNLKTTNDDLLKQGNLSTETANKLKKIGDAGDKVGNAGKKISTGVTAPVVALGGAAVKTFSDMTTAEGSVIDQTGKTGKEATKLRKSFENVYGQTAADSTTVANALGGVTTRFNFTGKAAEDASLKFIQYAKVNKQDVGQSVKDVSRAMGDAGIPAKNYSSVLDQLTVASQTSGISVDKLSQNMAKYGAPMRALGMDTKHSIAMFAGWEKAGVNTEIAFSGMKKAISNWGKEGKNSGTEFSKVMKQIKDAPNISDATAISIKNFGAKAGPDLADAIKGGRFEVDKYTKALEKSGGTLQKTATDSANPMKQAQTAAHQFQLALNELGTIIMATLAPAMKKIVKYLQDAREKFSKLSPSAKKNIVVFGAIAAAVGPAIVAIGKLMGAISNIGKGLGALKKGLSTAVKAFKAMNAVLVGNPWVAIGLAIAAVVSALVIFFTKTKEGRKIWAEFTKWLSDTWNKLKKTATDVFNAIKKTITDVWNSIKKSVTDSVNVTKKVITDTWNAIKDVTNTVWNGIKKFIETIWNGIKTVINTVIDAIKTIITNDWNLIKTITTNVFNAAKKVVETVWNAIKKVVTDVVNAVKDAVTTAWNAIKDVTSNVFNSVKKVASDVWNGIKKVISDVVNGIKKTVSDVWNTIKKVTTDVWNGIKKAMTGPVEAAKNTISRIIDTIKGFFSNLHLRIPKIEMPPLPHFHLDGSFSLKPPSVPHLSVDWHAKGGIFTQPTIFGANNGNLQGAGEAGPEAALPLNEETLGAIGKGIASSMSNGDKTITMQVDGRTFAQIIGPYVSDYLQQQDATSKFSYGRRPWR